MVIVVSKVSCFHRFPGYVGFGGFMVVSQVSWFTTCFVGFEVSY